MVEQREFRRARSGKVMGRHSAVLVLLVDQVESGRESGRSVLEQGGFALRAPPTPDHKSDILVTGGRLTSFSRESALEALSSVWPGRGVQAAMTFVVLTPEFNTLGDPLPPPTARDSDTSTDTDTRRRRVMFGSSCMAEFLTCPISCHSTPMVS